MFTIYLPGFIYIKEFPNFFKIVTKNQNQGYYIHAIIRVPGIPCPGIRCLSGYYVREYDGPGIPCLFIREDKMSGDISAGMPSPRPVENVTKCALWSCPVGGALIVYAHLKNILILFP